MWRTLKPTLECEVSMVQRVGVFVAVVMEPNDDPRPRPQLALARRTDCCSRANNPAGLLGAGARAELTDARKRPRTAGKLYGTAKSKQLAVDNPDRALKNADNFGYFVLEFK
ncbi:M35 family metallo-endopeptidase [Nannocystis pusilla]|uniref:M35 family metallo-endopeptidase n=1 Tax=Nannocystis pusilla TaxID=889268 RepID=A0A9X3F3V5_9BACT|nr:M35 family metallo-endopeptidase [Nannocystis pusilla]MCY1010956.1 M35 family metallo-endopeptidase [Nannocystis pusilla]